MRPTTNRKTNRTSGGAVSYTHLDVYKRQPEGGGEPIFVAERNSAHAMNNDKVRIAFYAKRRGRDAEGEVIEILERANAVSYTHLQFISQSVGCLDSEIYLGQYMAEFQRYPTGCLLYTSTNQSVQQALKVLKEGIYSTILQ